MKTALFPTGELLVTPGAFLVFVACRASVDEYLERHARGDWGVLDAHDRCVNEEALRKGHRLLSAYDLPVESANGDSQTPFRIWIITDADRSRSTVLLPDEY